VSLAALIVSGLVTGLPYHDCTSGCGSKGYFGSDSEAGSQCAERLLTVVASCRQQARPLLDFLVCASEAALRASLPPSLLQAPKGG
jgi:hypothetical protein